MVKKFFSTLRGCVPTRMRSVSQKNGSQSLSGFQRVFSQEDQTVLATVDLCNQVELLELVVSQLDSTGLVGAGLPAMDAPNRAMCKNLPAPASV
jgi:hypothetical protein